MRWHEKNNRGERKGWGTGGGLRRSFLLPLVLLMPPDAQCIIYPMAFIINCVRIHATLDIYIYMCKHIFEICYLIHKQRLQWRVLYICLRTGEGHVSSEIEGTCLWAPAVGPPASCEYAMWVHLQLPTRWREPVGPNCGPSTVGPRVEFLLEFVVGIAFRIPLDFLFEFLLGFL
jgi:hypothetical protein